MMDKLSWLLVGAGDIAQKRVAPALAGCKNSELTAVCDLRKEAAIALSHEFGVSRVYSDFDSAIADSDADAVYLATPVSLHVDQLISALEAGKHVLVEKPLGLSGEQCMRAMSAAEKSGKIAACAYFRRLFPRYIYAKEMIENGEFGRIMSARMTYFSWFSPSPEDPKYWRVVRSKSGGGPLSDMGTHMFDVLIGLLGMPASVYAKCDNLLNDWDVEDSAALVMTLADGAQITASFNWNSKTWRHEFEIVGTEAKLDWLPYDSGPIIKTVGRNTQNIDLPSAENVHLPLVEDFVRSVLTGTPPVSPISEAAKTNFLLDAVYASAATGKPVPVQCSQGGGN